MERQGLWARGPKRTVACLCEMAGMLGIQSTLSEQSRAKRRRHGQWFILPIQVKTDLKKREKRKNGCQYRAVLNFQFLEAGSRAISESLE